jgi:hypothetical protein
MTQSTAPFTEPDCCYEAKTQSETRNVPQSKDSIYNSGGDDDSGLRAYGEDMND